MMFQSPQSLEAICLDFIRKNLHKLCEVDFGDDDDAAASLESYNFLIDFVRGNSALTLRFKRFKTNDHVVLPSSISEPILTIFSEKELFSDLSMTLFGSKNARLKHVVIKDATRLSIKGLEILKQHDIVYLEVKRLSITIKDLLTCLNDWTLQNLKSLIVPHGTFMESSWVSYFRAISKLTALQELNVSYTKFNHQDLTMVVENLPHLESLNISCTRVLDITPLKECKDRLKILLMHSVAEIAYENALATFLELNELHTLDISVEIEMNARPRSKANRLLEAVNSLPQLTSLDLSGESNIRKPYLSKFIQAHPRLSFLGLVWTSACSMECLKNPSHPDYRPNLKVAGMSSENQIIESLKRYPDRPTYLHDCIAKTFCLMDSVEMKSADVIKFVLPLMQVYPKDIILQTNATGCLHHFTRDEQALQIHPSTLNQIVDLTLAAMSFFPECDTILRTGLMIMNNNIILYTATFDKYSLAMLLFHRLFMFHNVLLNTFCVRILSILTSRMPIIETSALGSMNYIIHKLLAFVNCAVTIRCADTVTELPMGTLRNLTNESLVACRNFIRQDGIQMYFQILEDFSGEPRKQMRVLSVLNNIAEFSELRHQLMATKFMNMLPMLMDCEQIDVSYHAAAIAAHLLSDDEPQFWTDDPSVPTKIQILEQLSKVVTNWQAPEYIIVPYRSFKPFVPLLQASKPYPVQLWAVWAIHHACSKNPKHYCGLLRSISGAEILEYLEEDNKIQTQKPKVRLLCRSILDILALHPS